MQPFVQGAVETLGQEAAGGSVQAAKIVLEFLTTMAREERHDDKGLDVLREIARIRSAQPA